MFYAFGLANAADRLTALFLVVAKKALVSLNCFGGRPT